jgi:HlyD family secretion protein
MTILERLSPGGASAPRTTTFNLDPRRLPFPLRAIAAALVIFALIVTGVLVARDRSAAAPAYATTAVTQADLVQSVTATGTVNPQNTIDVGTQVSGTISEVDADYNTKVHRGQVLARLDPTALQAALASAQAGLAQAQAQAAAERSSAAGASIGIVTAGASASAAAASARAAQATALSSQQAIASADAAVTKAQSALSVAQLTSNRDASLLSAGYVAQSQADADQANLVAAQTALQSAQIGAQQARSQAVAGAAQAQAGLEQSAEQAAAVQAARIAAAGGADTAQAGQAAIAIQAAAVQQAQTNLAHSVITSPVDGTVIARDVSVGTTVAASLQTPTLFAIAQDLSKMEVDLAVGEPDIGAVRTGENVAFTVLAFPNRTFHGVVSQVRKNPVVTQNVVTYTTVVLVDNADQALLPGMTANATIDVQTAPNALIVPLAALSYAPAFSGTHAQGTHAPASTTPWGATLGSSATAPAAGGTGRVFVQRAGKLVRVPVGITLISGAQAAVVPAGDAALAAGDLVVTGGGSAATPRGPRAATGGNPLAGGGAPGGALRGIH